jgi:hypothetical protein
VELGVAEPVGATVFVGLIVDVGLIDGVTLTVGVIARGVGERSGVALGNGFKAGIGVAVLAGLGATGFTAVILPDVDAFH